MDSLKKLVLLNMLAAVAAKALWNCPEQCHCLWSMGDKTANCSYAGFTDIPSLSPEIQTLNLTGNTITEITRYSLVNNQLYSLHKLLLRECKLNKIHKYGLDGMSILIELDLSKNYLTTLSNDTFQGMTKLRWLFINDNQLEKLEDGLFTDLIMLRKVNLSNNRILQISVSCFGSLSRLNYINLDNNRLVALELDTFKNLNSLSSLELKYNPWRCDCKLWPLRDWMLRKMVATNDNVTCSEPANLGGKSWKDLIATDFICQPDIKVISTTESVEPTTSLPIQTSNTNNTLTCQVNGKPLPELNWSPNSQWEVKYYVCGDYLCMSRSVEERVLKLSKAVSSSAAGNEY